MKKLIYIFILTILGITATSCDPMEDINEVIDAKVNSDKVTGTVEDYTLTDEDYETLDLGFGSFNSIEDARALIPQVLNSNFPVLGNNSLANVNFNLYAPIQIEDYTVTAEDYTDAGINAGYVSNNGEIDNILKIKYPQAAQGDYVSLTYSTTSDEVMYTISDEDFDLIGNELGDKYIEPASSAAEFKNFDRREGQDAYWNDEMILEAINVVLLENFENTAGQKYNVSYPIYTGSSGTESMSVLYDGNAYVAAGNTTAYELVNNDYALIGGELAGKYPKPADNAGQFNSFEIRSDSDNYWSDPMILEALNIVLKEKYPNAGEDAQFQVTYATYNGNSGTQIKSVIKQDTSYIVDENAGVSTIETTTVFAYTSGNWAEPFMLAPEDYTAMGQSHPNFDDEDEAFYKTAIFLGKEFPYAEPDDFVALAYDFYNGENTSTRYANFTFDGSTWSNIPSTIEQTLQFGNDGETWVPDNTIAYTLVAADYDYIATTLASADGFAEAAGNLANYGNFNRTGGSSSWSDDMIITAMASLLDNIDPSAEEGQKYALSYEIYNNGSGTETVLLIKTDGEWVEN